MRLGIGMTSACHLGGQMIERSKLSPSELFSAWDVDDSKELTRTEWQKTMFDWFFQGASPDLWTQEVSAHSDAAFTACEKMGSDNPIARRALHKRGVVDHVRLQRWLLAPSTHVICRKPNQMIRQQNQRRKQMLARGQQNMPNTARRVDISTVVEDAIASSRAARGMRDAIAREKAVERLQKWACSRGQRWDLPPLQRWDWAAPTQGFVRHPSGGCLGEASPQGFVRKRADIRLPFGGLDGPLTHRRTLVPSQADPFDFAALSISRCSTRRYLAPRTALTAMSSPINRLAMDGSSVGLSSHRLSGYSTSPFSSENSTTSRSARSARSAHRPMRLTKPLSGTTWGEASLWASDSLRNSAPLTLMRNSDHLSQMRNSDHLMDHLAQMSGSILCSPSSPSKPPAGGSVSLLVPPQGPQPPPNLGPHPNEHSKLGTSSSPRPPRVSSVRLSVMRPSQMILRTSPARLLTYKQEHVPQTNRVTTSGDRSSPGARQFVAA